MKEGLELPLEAEFPILDELPKKKSFAHLFIRERPIRLIVDLIRIDNSLTYRDQKAISKLPKEATLITFVARCALLANLQEDCVRITVDEDLFNRLNVPAHFTLAPKSLSTATIVDSLSAIDRFVECLSVHIGQHQHFIGLSILRDDREN